MRDEPAAAGLALPIVSVVCVSAFAGKPADSPRRPTICFGGVPETAVAGATGASDLSIVDGQLYWSNAPTGGLSRGDPGMSGFTLLNRRFGNDLQVGAIDGNASSRGVTIVETRMATRSAASQPRSTVSNLVGTKVGTTIRLRRNRAGPNGLQTYQGSANKPAVTREKRSGTRRSA